MATVSDDFNRSDGEIGADWTEDNGDIDIVSNRAENQGTSQHNRARYTGSSLDGADHYVEVDVTNQGSGPPDGGPTARQASSTFTCYQVKYVETTDCRLLKIQSGGETQIDSYSISSGEHTIRVTCDGSSITGDVDGTERLSATDSDITSGNYPGLAGWHNRASFDNFEAADLAAGGGNALPMATNLYRMRRAS